MKLIFAGYSAVLGLLLIHPATASDLGTGLPTAPFSPEYSRWAGLYVGGHFGYAGGRSNWLAAQGSSSLIGSQEFFNSFDAFKGTGSYYAGLQAGYNVILPSRLLLGIEIDFSAPNMIVGNETSSSGRTGQQTYIDTVLDFGTLRGRIGYALSDVMFYGTGGLAWSYDKIEQTRPGGFPTGIDIVAGATNAAYLWRWGWTAGAGIEIPIAQSWTAKLEYLTTDFGNRQQMFASTGQVYTSNLMMQSLRLGVNYQLGPSSSNNEVFITGVPPLNTDSFSIHGQTTFVSQYVLPFRAPYSGQNSLAPNAVRETWDLDLYLGFRPWKDAEFWVDPEIDQGFGLSGTFGVAGFPSAEAYKVGSAYPYARIPRAFLRQTINLGGEIEKVDAGFNQFAGSQTTDRVIITVGKFSVVDVFDKNKYANDPRADFLNWTLVNTGTFDYAADAWAFNYGSAIEWYIGPWSLRAGIFDGPSVPNSSNLDPTFGQFQMVGEVERRYTLWDQPGKVLLTGYLTRARMGNFSAAVQLGATTGLPPDLSLVRTYTSKAGISANWEQQILPGFGLFARAGYTPGHVEAYAFTDDDATLAGGASLSGRFWGRPNDTFRVAGVLNTISKAHQAYLAAGGYTALIGDGALPNPGAEKIVEASCTLPIYAWQFTFDYQFIANPAYNRDRGPLSIFATRLHAQF